MDNKQHTSLSNDFALIQLQRFISVLKMLLIFHGTLVFLHGLILNSWLDW